MCGIVGYIGNNDSINPVIKGLKALEYRGYDSAGITAISDQETITLKTVGRVESLEEKVLEENIKDSNISIGHTRWATHGIPSDSNAHPHSNKDNTIHVVHNGIIENYHQLREQLRSDGYEFYSDTDTEVIPKLIDFHLKNDSNFLTALKNTLSDVSGAYAIAVIDSTNPNVLYVAKLSSPLVIGVGENENFIASDISAISDFTDKVIYLEDNEIAVIKADSIKIVDLVDSTEIKKVPEKIDHESQKSDLGEYEHYMIKEIYEAPQTVQSASLGRIKPETNTVKLGGLESVSSQLKFIDKIVIVACGTSYYAGMVGKYLIEEIAGIPVDVELASEFKYRKQPFSRSTAILAISQSGETADTIAALKKVENYGVLRLGIVNVVGSTISRMTDAGVYCHAGPEKSVASTKAFIAQVTVLTEIALHLSSSSNELYKPIIQELSKIPDKINEILKDTASIKKLAKKYMHNRDFLYIGRNYMFPCAMEGALKLKEVSYIHAEGYSAGEMKHGPLAMIDKDFPTFALCPSGELHDKTLSNIEEIVTRKGPVIVITDDPHSVNKLTEDILVIPKTIEQLQPLLVAVTMQLFAYFVARGKKLDIDMPRNLAKSVTVE